MNKILLYDRVVSPSQSHTINLVNPTFTGTTGWVTRTTEWSFGGGYANFIHVSTDLPIWQSFPNSILPRTYYTIGFTIEDLTQGGLEVNMGTDFVGAISGNGTYALTYYSSSGFTTADRISFTPTSDDSGYFDGKLKDISIVQDDDLSTLQDEINFEPKGYLDLYDDEPIALNLRVNDFRAINSRESGYSKTFTIPGTANNKRLLGHLHTNEVVPRLYDPKNKTKAIFLGEDVNIFEGWLLVQNIYRNDDGDEYEIQLLETSFGLLDDIRGKSIKDLDLGRYDHKLTLDNVVGSWDPDRSWKEGYQYPVGLHLGGVNYTINDDFTPSVFYRAVFDRIFKEAGYGYKLSSGTSEVMDRMLVWPNNGYRPGANIMEMQKERVWVSSNAGQTWLTSNAYAGGIGNAHQIAEVWELNSESIDTESNWDALNLYGTAPYTAVYDIDMMVQANIYVEFTYPVTASGFFLDGNNSNVYDSKIVFQLEDYDTGEVILQTNAWRWETYYSSLTASTTFAFSANTQVELTAGQRIRWVGYAYNRMWYLNYGLFGGGATAPQSTWVYPVEGSSYFDWKPSNTNVVGENMTVRLTDWLPDIPQDGFIEEAIRGLNLYFIPNVDDPKSVDIYTRPELYDVEQIIDYTHDIDLSKGVGYQYLSEITSNKIEFGYDEPMDYDTYNVLYEKYSKGEQYGDNEFVFNTDFYDSTSEIRFRYFTPCPIAKDDFGKFVPAVLTREEVADCKLLMLGMTSYKADGWNIEHYDVVHGYSATTSPETYVPTLHVNDITGSTIDLNFDQVQFIFADQGIDVTANNLYNKYYLDQLYQWKESRLVTCYVRMGISDYIEHKRYIGAAIWVEELNGWFHLVQIVDFDPKHGKNKLTKVQLLEAPPTKRRWDNFGSITTTPLLDSSVGNIYNLTGPLTPTRYDTTGGYLPQFGVNKYYSTNNVYSNALVLGNNNTVWYGDGSNIVTGNGNVVGGGVTGTTILGGNGITAQTSNTTYLDGFATLSPSGTTLYENITIRSSAITVTSAVTMTHTGFTVGDVALTSSGLTVGGVLVPTASTPTELTLQQVTDYGDETTNNIYFTDAAQDGGGRIKNPGGTSGLWFMVGESDGYAHSFVGHSGDVSDKPNHLLFSSGGYTIHVSNFTGETVSTSTTDLYEHVFKSNHSGGTFLSIGYAVDAAEKPFNYFPAIRFQNTDDDGNLSFQGVLRSKGLTNDRAYDLPDMDGTLMVEEKLIALDYIKFSPKSSIPTTPSEGVVFYSAGTGLLVCTGNSASDWVRL